MSDIWRSAPPPCRLPITSKTVGRYVSMASRAGIKFDVQRSQIKRAWQLQEMNGRNTDSMSPLSLFAARALQRNLWSQAASRSEFYAPSPPPSRRHLKRGHASGAVLIPLRPAAKQLHLDSVQIGRTNPVRSQTLAEGTRRQEPSVAGKAKTRVP